MGLGFLNSGNILFHFCYNEQKLIRVTYLYLFYSASGEDTATGSIILSVTTLGVLFVWGWYNVTLSIVMGW